MLMTIEEEKQVTRLSHAEDHRQLFNSSKRCRKHSRKILKKIGKKHTYIYKIPKKKKKRKIIHIKIETEKKS